MKRDNNNRDGITNWAKVISEYRGLYNRVAKELGVDPSYVSRIARGERFNQEVEAALLKELERLHGLSSQLIE
jgi:transcriptional regulator with XRE-family HTH domain